MPSVTPSGISTLKLTLRFLFSWVMGSLMGLVDTNAGTAEPEVPVLHEDTHRPARPLAGPDFGLPVTEGLADGLAVPEDAFHAASADGYRNAVLPTRRPAEVGRLQQPQARFLLGRLAVEKPPR